MTTFCQTELEQIESGRREYGAAMNRLRGAGSVWHCTSTDNLRAILDAGCILPSTGARWTFFHGLTIGAVCLFDFDSATEDEIFCHAWKWGPFLTLDKPVTVAIEIPRRRLDSDLWEPAYGAGNPRRLPPLHDGRFVPMFIPYVEAWHRGPIQAASFSRYVVFAQPERELQHRDAPVGPDAVATIEAIGVEWAEQRRRYLAAREKEWRDRPRDPVREQELAEKMRRADERLARARDGDKARKG